MKVLEKLIEKYNWNINGVSRGLRWGSYATLATSCASFLLGEPNLGVDTAITTAVLFNSSNFLYQPKDNQYK